MQTQIICPQTYNWNSHFTYCLFLHYTLKNATAYTSSQNLLNKSAMHAVISLLLQSRKLWRYLLLTFSMLLHDVIMTSYCCQWYAECLVTTLCSSGTVQCTSTPRRARATIELLRQETPNFLVHNLWPPNSPDLSPVDYESWAVMQHRVYHKQIHIVTMNWNCGSSLSGAVLNSRFLTRLLTSQRSKRSKVKEIIVLIKARSFLDELNLEHLTSWTV